MNIAIDGPAGAGKSTIARLLAKELGLRYLDTGAMYRAVTLEALRKGLSLDDEEELVKMVTSMDLEIVFGDESEGNLLFLGDENITELIRQPEISSQVSTLSKHKKVRDLVSSLQKEIGKSGSIVMDGRDIGTVVMPYAEWKFFLEASVQERAKRRKKQLEEKGLKVDLAELEAQISERDFLDKTRKNSPLIKADGAIEIDTTSLGIEEVVHKLLGLIRED
ncbi:MAG: (d)CMP kinase [Bacillota bacterium]|nr:(d)CMP kinase [Bacillota bacterium]HHU62182.1 (d)CMP kinase [Natronincola sp.]